MKNLFLFFNKIKFFLSFILLQLFVFTLLVSNSSYQQARILNSSAGFSGWVFKQKQAVINYFNLRKENEILSHQNALLKQESFHNYTILSNDEILIEDEKYAKQFLYQPAVIIQNSTRSRRNILTLNVGKNKKVTSEMGVVSPSGIVGFTRDVSTHFSTVISLMHSDFNLPVMPKKDSCNGVLFWDKNDKINEASVKGIPSYFEIKIGDTVVTQGGSGFFPKGEMVGTITKVIPQNGSNNVVLKIKTAVDFYALNHVFVVKKYLQRRARFSINHFYTMRLILVNIVRFIFLVLLQVFVFNHIHLGFLTSYFYLAIYLSFLFTFPINVSRYITLLVALFLGLAVDLFQNTDGIHASACLLVGFARPYLLARFKSDSPIEEVQELTVYTEDLQKYITYCLALSLLFFFWLFLLEEFSLSELPYILLKTLLSSVATTVFIIIGQYLLFRKPKNT